MLLDTHIVQQSLKGTGWKQKTSSIFKTYTFTSFKDALLFVQEVGDIAEKRKHHPGIEINYTRVKLTLSTHDEGGVTEQDISMAFEINELY